MLVTESIFILLKILIPFWITFQSFVLLFRLISKMTIIKGSGWKFYIFLSPHPDIKSNQYDLLLLKLQKVKLVCHYLWFWWLWIINFCMKIYQILPKLSCNMPITSFINKYTGTYSKHVYCNLLSRMAN